LVVERCGEAFWYHSRTECEHCFAARGKAKVIAIDAQGKAQVHTRRAVELSEYDDGAGKHAEQRLRGTVGHDNRLAAAAQVEALAREESIDDARVRLAWKLRQLTEDTEPPIIGIKGCRRYLEGHNGEREWIAQPSESTTSTVIAVVDEELEGLLHFECKSSVI
jgi:hypothetical protein